MESGVVSGVIGGGSVVVGVILGWLLQNLTGRQAAKREKQERKDWARHEREIVAAEQLDEALVRVFKAFQGRPTQSGYEQAFNDWSEGWIGYSERIRDRELRERYRSVGSMLMELVDADVIGVRVPAHHGAAAVRNARVALAHFLREDENALPAASFPDVAELVSLLNAGEAQGDRLGPLREWRREHPGRDARPSTDDS